MKRGALPMCDLCIAGRDVCSSEDCADIGQGLWWQDRSRGDTWTDKPCRRRDYTPGGTDR